MFLKGMDLMWDASDCEFVPLTDKKFPRRYPDSITFKKHCSNFFLCECFQFIDLS